VPRQIPSAGDDEYRLTPLVSNKPEVVIDEEPIAASASKSRSPAPQAASQAAPPVIPQTPIAQTPPPAPVARVIEPPVSPPPLAAAEPVAASNVCDEALAALFAPVQVTTSWEASLGLANSVSTTEATLAAVTPAVTKALAPTPPKPSPAPEPAPTPKPAPEVRSAAPEVAPPVARQPQPPAAKSEARAPLTAATMRLDTLTSAPVPQPHAKFVEAAAPKAAASEPVSPPPRAPSAKVAEPKVAPPLPPSPPSPPSTGPLQPAWEVDRFQWPEHCKQLLSPQSQYLADVGQRLSIAARDGLNILAVTSTRRGEGRTTLALCLAKAAAAAGVKVALVDADLENPQLVNELGVEAAAGWHDVVLNKQPLSEAAIVSLEDRFTFFPWLENSGLKSLNDPQVTRVLRAIAAEHTLVVLDLGPVPGRETQLFEDGEACPIDAAILVRDVRWTSALEAQRVAGQLMALGAGSVGIAENFGPRVTSAAA
jgi:Mrp family chromosome partitioning ATPase